MRITDRYQNLMVRPAPTPPVDKVGKAADAGRAASSGNVEVKLSPEAQKLAASAQRLDQLRAAVQSGSFRVDASAIASRLLGEDAASVTTTS